MFSVKQLHSSWVNNFSVPIFNFLSFFWKLPIFPPPPFFFMKRFSHYLYRKNQKAVDFTFSSISSLLCIQWSVVLCPHYLLIQFKYCKSYIWSRNLVWLLVTVIFFSSLKAAFLNFFFSQEFLGEEVGKVFLHRNAEGELGLSSQHLLCDEIGSQLIWG